MKSAQYYAVNEEIYIKTKVTGVVIGEDGFKYYLRNPESGRPFSFTFAEDQVFPIDGGKDGED